MFGQAERLAGMVLLLLLLAATGGNVAAGETGLTPGETAARNSGGKTRFMVVSSYHREYIWSQETNAGLCDALIEFGYLDNSDQVAEYTRNDFVESSKAVIKKVWMNSKTKDSKSEIAETLIAIIGEIDFFRPDIILLGDDNAANYVGNHYLDSAIPVVFWGINGQPLKYGIVDTMERPGHNVTGVYQHGYHLEGFEYLQKIVPGIRTVAVLSDDSPTGRAHAKRIERYMADGELPVAVKEIVITNYFSEWKDKALTLQQQVDAFFISTHNTLTDDAGKHIDYLAVAAWYLRNIHKPEVTPAGFFVEEGFFSTVEDSAYKQGYEAMKMAHLILVEGLTPATMPPIYPARGPFMVNRGRAKMLGLEEVIKKNENVIDKYIDTMAALEEHPE